MTNEWKPPGKRRNEADAQAKREQLERDSFGASAREVESVYGLDKDWQEKMDRIAAEHLRIIHQNREVYVAAFLAETGLHPSECELVETRSTDGMTTTVRIQKRGATP